MSLFREPRRLNQRCARNTHHTQASSFHSKGSDILVDAVRARVRSARQMPRHAKYNATPIKIQVKAQPVGLCTYVCSRQQTDAFASTYFGFVVHTNHLTISVN